MSVSSFLELFFSTASLTPAEFANESCLPGNYYGTYGNRRLLAFGPDSECFASLRATAPSSHIQSGALSATKENNQLMYIHKGQ